MRRILAVLFVILILVAAGGLWWYSLQISGIVQAIYDGESTGRSFFYWMMIYPFVFAAIVPVGFLILLVFWAFGGGEFLRRLVLRMFGIAILWAVLMLAYISNPPNQPVREHISTVQIRDVTYHLGGLNDIFGNRYVVYACGNLGLWCYDVFSYTWRDENPPQIIRLVADPLSGLLILEIDGQAVFNIRSA